MKRDRAYRRWRAEQKKLKVRLNDHHSECTCGVCIGDPKAVGIGARTPVPCSCWMCGNPRRYYGEPTVQEQRAEKPLKTDN